jgi:hypothetical protein
MTKQKIADEYLKSELTVKPDGRLHRIVALLFDTYYDDLSDARIAEVERFIEGFRWCNAAGKRIDVEDAA